MGKKVKVVPEDDLHKRDIDEIDLVIAMGKYATAYFYLARRW